MEDRVKKLLKIVAALLVLLIVAAVAAPLLISADTLKAQAVAQISKATGRQLTIDGKASLKLFPTLAVSLENVSLSNPAGDFTSKRMFFARKLEAGMQLVPLLGSQVNITGVTLDGAEINLEQNAAGVKNWDFAGAKPATQQAATQEAAAKPAHAIAIGDINIKDSSVNYLVAGQPPVALSAINLSVKGADGSKPLAVNGSANYREQKVTITLNMRDSRGVLSGSESPVELQLSLPGGQLAFSGKASKAPSASGTVKLELADVPALVQWATGKPAAASLPKSLRLDGPLSIQGKQYSLNSFTASGDALSASGKLMLDMSAAVPSLTGALKLGSIDLATFDKSPAKAAAGAPNAAATPAPAGGWNATPIDLSALTTVNAKLDLAIDGIKKDKLALGSSALNVDLQNGVLKLIISKMALYGGNAHGSLALSNGGLATALDVDSVQIEPLMNALAGQSRLTGTASLKLNLTAAGNSQRAWVDSLGGTASLVAKDGAVKGINLAQFLQNAQQGNLSGGDNQATAFSSLGSSFKFASGVGTTSDISLISSALHVTGSGTVSLPPKTLNLKLSPSIITAQNQPGLSVPLTVTGSWSNSHVTPDVKGLVNQVIQNPDAMKQNLKNLKQGLKNFNSPKDIFKALGGK